MSDLYVVVAVLGTIMLFGVAIVACDILVKRPRTFREALVELRRMSERPEAAPLAYQKKRRA